MRKVFSGLLAAAAAALLFVMPAWSAADPGQFVKNVTGQLADIARTKSGTSRDAAVREVLRNNFDLAHMALSIFYSFVHPNGISCQVHT